MTRRDIGGCTVDCEAMPECTTCRRQKPPRGRDVALACGGTYCEHECPGHNEPPHAGHLWPGELGRLREEDEDTALERKEGTR
jgi:hypothetical protein